MQPNAGHFYLHNYRPSTRTTSRSIGDILDLGLYHEICTYKTRTIHHLGDSQDAILLLP